MFLIKGLLTTSAKELDIADVGFQALADQPVENPASQSLPLVARINDEVVDHGMQHLITHDASKAHQTLAIVDSKAIPTVGKRLDEFLRSGMVLGVPARRLEQIPVLFSSGQFGFKSQRHMLPFTKLWVVG